MCGLVSIISRRNNGFFTADLEMFENMLVFDTIRGLDSTGVFSVAGNKNVDYMKIASHPFHLFACDAWKKWRGKAVSNSRMLIGHNRKATQGAVSSENAHPFHENNIILVHNGTLRGDHKKMADTEVDSHALCVAFNEKGAENIIPTINGAFALIWWDMEKNRLFAVRNSERPLYLVTTDEAYFLVSEPWMATGLLQRTGKKITDVLLLPEGELYSFAIGGEYTTKTLTLDEKLVTTYSKTQGGTQLTVVRNPPTTTGPTQTTTPVTPFVNSDGHSPCLDYPTWSETLVKFYEMKLAEKKTYYLCRGKTIEPGQEVVDVVCYLPVAGIADGEQIKYLENALLGKVTKHLSGVCGRTIWVNNVYLAPLHDVHNGKVTDAEWNYAVAHCPCSKCNAQVTDADRAFTSVNRRTGNKLSITCPDCIEDSLIGDIKNAFTEDRLTALQEYERLSNEAASLIIDQPSAVNSQTLH